MPLCHYLWYEDWKCAECCQGDRCNYYVTVSILSFGKLHCLPLVYHSLLTQKLSLITVGSFQPNTQQIPCLGLNDSIISSNSNITVNKLMYIIIFSFLQCCIAKVDRVDSRSQILIILWIGTIKCITHPIEITLILICVKCRKKGTGSW